MNFGVWICQTSININTIQGVLFRLKWQWLDWTKYFNSFVLMGLKSENIVKKYYEATEILNQKQFSMNKLLLFLLKNQTYQFPQKNMKNTLI